MNFVQLTDKPKTNDLGYLLSNRPWNKASEEKSIILCFLGKVHDIIKSLSENRLRPAGRERR